MSPLEVNKKIAELQGRRIFNTEDSMWMMERLDESEGVNGLYSVTEEYDDGATEEIKVFDLRNWAENISDAWELFEEMPLGFSIMRDKEYNWCLFHNSIWSVAPTAPMAIALAWLKWKESK